MPSTESNGGEAFGAYGLPPSHSARVTVHGAPVTRGASGKHVYNHNGTGSAANANLTAPNTTLHSQLGGEGRNATLDDDVAAAARCLNITTEGAPDFARGASGGMSGGCESPRRPARLIRPSVVPTMITPPSSDHKAFHFKWAGPVVGLALLAGACQRHGVGGFLLRNSSSSSVVGLAPSLSRRPGECKTTADCTWSGLSQVYGPQCFDASVEAARNASVTSNATVLPVAPADDYSDIECGTLTMSLCRETSWCTWKSPTCTNATAIASSNATAASSSACAVLTGPLACVQLTGCTWNGTACAYTTNATARS